MDNRLFNVIGISDFEGVTFGRFTTYSKAQTAKEMLKAALEAAGFEDRLDIVQDEIPIDHIEIDGKMIKL